MLGFDTGFQRIGDPHNLLKRLLTPFDDRPIVEPRKRTGSSQAAARSTLAFMQGALEHCAASETVNKGAHVCTDWRALRRA